MTTVVERPLYIADVRLVDVTATTTAETKTIRRIAWATSAGRV